MQLTEFKWIPKPPSIPRYVDKGNQIVLDFGTYELSIIDDGYGGDLGLYEIAVFKGNSQVELPGITRKGDTVQGFLTERDVDVIIKKMYTITGVEPTQV